MKNKPGIFDKFRGLGTINSDADLEAALAKKAAAPAAAAPNPRPTAAPAPDKVMIAAKKSIMEAKATFPGKYNNAPIKPITADSKLVKLEAAAARFKKDDYSSVVNGFKIRDFAQKDSDRSAVRELNLHRAQQAHDTAKLATGAWITESRAGEDYQMLGTTLQRLTNAGHILKHSVSNLYSRPSIESYLNSIA